jgi:hypothetical protein
MKHLRWLLLVFALCVAVPAFGAESKSGTPGATGATGATGPAGPAPTGNAPQVVGYSAANTAEAETITGDFTLTRAGANSYTAAIGNVPAGALANKSSVAGFYRAPVTSLCGALPTANAGATFISVGTALCNATVGVAEVPENVACTYKNLICRVPVAPGASNSYSFTLNDGNTDEALTTTISGTNTVSAIDSTHSYTTTPSTSLMTIHVVTTVGGSAVSVSPGFCKMECDI